MSIEDVNNKPSKIDVAMTRIRAARTIVLEAVKHPFKPFGLIIDDAQRTVTVSRIDYGALYMIVDRSGWPYGCKPATFMDNVRNILRRK